jgi:hypothetical protein
VTSSPGERLERRRAERGDDMHDAVVLDLDPGFERRDVGDVVSRAADRVDVGSRRAVDTDRERGAPAVEHDDAARRVDERAR